MILGGALGRTPAAAPALREINLGAWAGHTKAEIAERHPVEWSLLEAGEDIPRGGGETYAQFQARILEWLIPALQRHAGETIAVVTHGGVIRAVLLYALNLQWKDRSRIPSIGNASVSVLEIHGNRWALESAGLSSGADPDDAITPVNEGEVI
jgi:broad specificity phosphatase PhoE